MRPAPAVQAGASTARRAGLAPPLLVPCSSSLAPASRRTFLRRALKVAPASRRSPGDAGRVSPHGPCARPPSLGPHQGAMCVPHRREGSDFPPGTAASLNSRAAAAAASFMSSGRLRHSPGLNVLTRARSARRGASRFSGTCIASRVPVLTPAAQDASPSHGAAQQRGRRPCLVHATVDRAGTGVSVQCGCAGHLAKDTAVNNEG